MSFPETNIMKKSQVTVFVMVILLLLVSFGLIYLLSSLVVEEATDPASTFNPTLFPIEQYITQCIEHELRPLVQQMALQGGSFQTRESTFAGEVRFVLHYAPQQGNYLVSPKSAAEELANALKIRLDECIQTDVYTERGYAVTEGNKTVQSTIFPNQILVTLEYPIILERSDETIVFETIETHLETPFGAFLNHARDIINAELQGSFDADYFRLHNNIHIIKDTPYPYTIYTLETPIDPERSTYLKLHFGLEEYDKTIQKFSQPEILFPRPLQIYEGACYIDFNCYSYTQEHLCLEQNGTFNQKELCPISNRILTENILEQFSGEECTEWYDVNSGMIIEETYRTGESWCASEPGVGGRFYKLSCIDGTVFVEPCADYREEVCGSDTKEFSLASCRPNRFWSCTACETEDCCAHPRRDCIWHEQQCHPAVTPGIQFWRQQENLCSPTACLSTGDCGAQINFYGDGRASSEYHALARAQETATLPRSISSSNIDLLQTSEAPSRGFIETLNRYLVRLDELRAFSLETYLQEDIYSEFERFCSVFTPEIQRCDVCNVEYSLDDGTTNYAACTEYKCKSLGSQCRFEIENGTPRCFVPEFLSERSQITITTDTSHTEQTNVLGRGIHLSEPVSLYRQLQFNITTEQNSLCKLSYLPIPFDLIPTNDLSGFNYRTDHYASLLFTHTNDVLRELPSYLGVATFSEAIPKIIELRYAIEAGAKDTLGLYNILVAISDLYFERPEIVSYIFENIEQEKYHIFIQCINRAGQESETVHLSLELGDVCEGELEITHTQTDQQVHIYLNKIAQCKYDAENKTYEQMSQYFDCELNPYRATQYGYLCQTITDIDELYVTCRDLPERELSTVILSRGNESELPMQRTLDSTQIDITGKAGNYSIAFDTRFLEIHFEQPYTCQGFGCSSTRCISENVPEEIICTPRRSACTEQQEIHTMLSVNKTHLEINTSFEQPIVSVELNIDGRCGIQLDPAEGFLVMHTDNRTHTHRIQDTRVGSRTAEILCFSQGSEVRETLTFIWE